MYVFNYNINKFYMHILKFININRYILMHSYHISSSFHLINFYLGPFLVTRTGHHYTFIYTSECRRWRSRSQ